MLRTPSETCGVRGTAFSVSVGKKGVRVAVAEGDAALKASASMLGASATPISPSEERALEEFMAQPEAQEPLYLMSTSPAERAEETQALKTDWPNFGYWNRKPIDVSALPRMDAFQARVPVLRITGRREAPLQPGRRRLLDRDR